MRYAVSLDVTAADLARGAVDIGFHRAADSGDVVLDFRGPSLEALTVNGTSLSPATRRDGHIVLPARLLAVGANAVSARFTTPIAAADAAILRFHDEADRRDYLYTVLVPSNANLLFPCFDQPDLKARFTWEVTAPADWTVLTNGAFRSRAAAAAASGARWRFAETQPISTYLGAFAAGPWATWSSPLRAGQPITLYARRSRQAEVEAETLIRTNQAAVRWLEAWFARPFPFTKLDLLLAPAFPLGGMENPGAVFYAEDVMVFREPPTLPRRLNRDQDVYHEISHQWFGDLVTMRWFDDLWLKEGFANYMAARVQSELQPDSHAWTTFFLGEKTSAYRADATAGTQPLWQELDNLDAAKSNYGPIVYDKAPGVIKQLAFLVGERGFRAGLQLFLRRHAYANATWRDLLAAIAQASGVDLDAFGRQYILRAGLPRVDTRLVLERGRIASLALTQQPATALPGDPGGAWPMKVRVRLGYHDRPDVVLDAGFAGDAAQLPAAVGLPAPDYVWANDDDQGYGLFMPDARTTAWALDHVGGVGDPLLRAMLWGALWDVVRDLRLPPQRFLAAVLAQIGAERDEQISRAMLSHGGVALDIYLPEAAAAPLRPAWEAALIARMDDASLGYGLRKDALDRLIATARTPAALERLRTLLAGQAAFAGGPIRQPTRWAAIRRLLTLGAPDAPGLYAAERGRDRSTEAAKDAFVAGAAAASATAKMAYFDRYLHDASLNEAWASQSLDAFNPTEQAALTARFLRPALDQVMWLRQNRGVFFLPAWIAAFIGGQVSTLALAIVDSYLAQQRGLPIDIRRKILLSRDELERTIRIRAAALPRPPAEPE